MTNVQLQLFSTLLVMAVAVTGCALDRGGPSPPRFGGVSFHWTGKLDEWNTMNASSALIRQGFRSASVQPNGNEITGQDPNGIPFDLFQSASMTSYYNLTFQTSKEGQDGNIDQLTNETCSEKRPLAIDSFQKLSAALNFSNPVGPTCVPGYVFSQA